MPTDYLEIGRIPKIGYEEPQVDFFKILSIIIDNKEIKETKVLQKTETKFILNEHEDFNQGIIWSE